MEPAYITYSICPLLSLIPKVEAACSFGMLVSTCKVTQHIWKTMWTHTAGKIPDFISCVMCTNTPLASSPPESNLVYRMDKCFSCCDSYMEKKSFFIFPGFLGHLCGKKVNTKVRHIKDTPHSVTQLVVFKKLISTHIS